VSDTEPEPSAYRKVHRLRDGRRLAYVEWGALVGTPIFEFHGLPSPRQAETTSDVFLRDHEIHRITVDRPGVGFSDPLSQRKLVDWPDDVGPARRSMRAEEVRGLRRVRRSASRPGVRVGVARSCDRRGPREWARTDGPPEGLRHMIIFDRAEEIVGGLAEMSWSAPGRSGVPATGRDTRT
jgi:hypothetical protein